MAVLDQGIAAGGCNQRRVQTLLDRDRAVRLALRCIDGTVGRYLRGPRRMFQTRFVPHGTGRAAATALYPIMAPHVARRMLGIAMVTAATACPVQAGAPPSLRSGVFEAMVLAVSPSGRIGGNYHEEQGQGVVKTCDFSFSGQAHGAAATIRVTGNPPGYAPILIGRLTAAADGVVLRLPHARDLPGCGLVIGPMVEEVGGMPLDRLAEGAWSELAIVRGARVALRPTPGGAPGRSYVVRGDAVGVLARQQGQVKIVYPSERRAPSQGWVAARELAPLPR